MSELQSILRPTTTGQVAHEIREEAHALARRIEGPDLAAVSIETRTDFRAVTLLMLGWADRLEDGL